MILVTFAIFVICCFVQSICYKVEQLPADIALLGEGPHWDIEKQSLYYIDIDATVHRYSYDENKVYSAQIENEKYLSFIIPVEGEPDRFAVGIGHRVGVIHWDGFSSTATVERIVFEVETEEKYKDNAFNDAKADPTGRLVAGTKQIDDHDGLPENRIGNLYSYSKGGNVTRIRDKIAVSNGLAWNQKTKKMFYIDSWDLRVREFNYNFDTGMIDEGRVLIDFSVDGKKGEFVPDGMTIDTEGFLYVAAWGGSKILKINPADGEIVMKIDFPCEQVSSCAFGGPNLDILFVTSASIDDKPFPAGGTFKVTGLGAKGLPMQKVRL